jgi:hypothetical protein
MGMKREKREVVARIPLVRAATMAGRSRGCARSDGGGGAVPEAAVVAAHARRRGEEKGEAAA